MGSSGLLGAFISRKMFPLNFKLCYIASTEKCEDSEIFCIGPTADYMFWYERRAGLNLRCGPCECNFHYFEVQILIITGNDPKDYLLSVAQKEIEWTQRYGKPLELDFPHNDVFPGKKDLEDYLRLLEKYIALASYLLPKVADSSLNRPTLRHPGTSH